MASAFLILLHVLASVAVVHFTPNENKAAVATVCAVAGYGLLVWLAGRDFPQRNGGSDV